VSSETFIPEEFRKKYSGLAGSESAEFFEACATKIPKSIWMNSLKIRPEILARDLRKKGWKIERLFHENAYSVGGIDRPGQSEEFKRGLFNLQEKAAMIPAIALGAGKRDTALDATAAPGNKTLQMACIMNGAGKIIAVEKNVERFRSMKLNAQKWGLKNAVLKRMDLLDARRKSVFEKILLDAPCSSEGFMRKDFDALRNWNMELVMRKAQLQKKLMEKCLEMLKPEGILVYSTCTFAPEENEEVVQEIIKGGKAELMAVKIPGFKIRAGLTEYNGKKFDSSMEKAARIWPQDNDTQQFFLAKIRKTG